MSAESAHLSTFGAETEAEIRSISTHLVTEHVQQYNQQQWSEGQSSTRHVTALSLSTV